MEFLSIFGTLILSFVLLLIIKSNIKKSEIDEKKTNKDSLFYIGLVFTLCVSINSFLFIVFSIIDKLMPDPANFYYYQIGMQSEVALMIATTIIVFPLYLLFSYLIDKDIARDTSKRDLTLRKSVIYLALIVTSLTIISVIIATIYAYLMGSLLNTFLLKSLVVFLVSGFLFAYYYYSLDRNYKSSTRVPMILSILASLVILLTIVCSIYIFGSPSKVRDLNIDSAKVNDLTSISFSITNFYSQNNKLPENLNQLGNNLKDKETGLDYGYIVLSASSSKYFLCATFKTDVDYKNDYNLSDWSHTKGDYCFELDATKKQY